MAQPPLNAPNTPPGGLGALGPPASAVGCYPPAKATHEAVKNDRTIFVRCLRKLHEELGTQFRTPTVSGKELDLHMLYIQVTNHGGLEQVVTGKKWTEVSGPFKFPSSFTSKSFTLRKMYSRLLHDFEQVYFFNNTGPPVVPYGADGTKIEGGAAMSSSNPLYRRRRMEVQTTMQQSHNLYASPQMPHPVMSAFLQGPNAPQGSLIGQAISGRVEAQFDCGYFVSFSVGGHDYLGVLYNPPPQLQGGQLTGLGSGSGMSLHPQAQQQQMLTPVLPPPGHPQGPPQGPHGLPQAFSFYAGSPEGGAGPSGGGYYHYPGTPVPPSSKRQKIARDPNQPKQNKTPFNFFSVGAREVAKAKYPNASQKDISKAVGEMWSKTTEEEKEKYVKLAQEDKERYQKALENYTNLKRESSLENVGASSWPQPSGLVSVPSLTLTRTQLEDIGSAAQQHQMQQQQQQQLGMMPPQSHMGAHSAPPPSVLHPAFSNPPGHGGLGFPSASQGYQARQPRFGGIPGGTGEEHEDAALSMREMMLQSNEGAGHLTNIRQMETLHRQQQHQHQQLAAPYSLERTQLHMGPMLHSVQMPSSHGRGPHSLQEGGYEEVEAAEQEEYEDEGSGQE